MPVIKHAAAARDAQLAAENGTETSMPSPSAGRKTCRLDLHGWISRGPGMLLAEAERARMDEILPDLFGYHLVQVGRLGDIDLLSQSRILHKGIVDIDRVPAPAPYPFAYGTASTLPVESDSVDVIVLPHVLEFDEDPHAALREAFRVLVPEGHLLILGFNPRSPMGMWRPFRKRRGVAPWNGQFFGVSRIKDWLALLDFDVTQVQPCFVRPSFGNERWLRTLDAICRLGNLTAPVLSTAYLIAARKRVTRVMPIKTRWRPKPRLVGVGLAEPSARIINRE